MFVITADQRHSRRLGDLVPAALESLNTQPRRKGHVRAFERTAGDEIQGVLDSPAAVLDLVTLLVRTDAWRIGIGIGEVDRPLPRSTRAGRGSAFVAARAAVEAAHTSAQHLAVVSAHSPRPYAEGDPARDAESALWLTSSVLRRRTPEGWQAVDLLQQGMTQREAARVLGVSESAVSQRVVRAGWAEEQRGRELCLLHLALVDAS